MERTSEDVVDVAMLVRLVRFLGVVLPLTINNVLESDLFSVGDGKSCCELALEVLGQGESSVARGMGKGVGRPGSAGQRNERAQAGRGKKEGVWALTISTVG